MDVLGHFLVGVLSYLLFFENKLVFTFFIVGAVIIDIDHSLGFIYTSIRRHWKKEEKRIYWLKRLLYYDRSRFHSLWGAIIFSLIAYFATLDKLKAVSMFVGIIVHLLIDSFDQTGIKWFWPRFHIKSRLFGIGAWRPTKRFHKDKWFYANMGLILIIIIILLVKK
ncbi:metal-dependent hydrolase [Candidatus Woesearchaeota archaeon]|nr:MAG: metal-dependent hydrolase [Candidatus Woesearchaeota archaeon]